MKRFLLVPLFLLLMLTSNVHAREGAAFGATGNFNFFLTDTDPNLAWGAGGGLQLDWRFNQNWGATLQAFVSDHDGKGASINDNSQFLIGAPTFDIKYYPLSNETKIDPYLGVGIGFYILTEGTVNDNSSGVGIGGQFSLGADYYINEKLSIGLAAQFRSIGLIQSGSRSSALINFGFVGNILYHF